MTQESSAIKQAISAFAALPLAEKTAALAEAAVAAETFLTKNDERLGHPGDFHSDYMDLIGRNLLGIQVSYHDAADGLFAGGCGASILLRRAGFSIDASEERILAGINELVIASSTPDNEFLALIGGQWLNRTKPATAASPWTIQQHRLFAKTLQDCGRFKRVFIGDFQFVDARSVDVTRIDPNFGGRALTKKEFRCGALDVLVYSYGIEFAGYRGRFAGIIERLWSQK